MGSLNRPYEASLVRIAFTALAAGLAVYLLARPAGTLCCLPHWLYLDHSTGEGLTRLGGQLPAFLHTYAFILLSAAATAPWPCLTIPICAFWCLLEGLCEIGQTAAVSAVINGLVDTQSVNFPLADRIVNYFVAGRFDPFDLLAIMMGGLSAFLTIKIIQRNGGAP